MTDLGDIIGSSTNGGIYLQYIYIFMIYDIYIYMIYIYTYEILHLSTLPILFLFFFCIGVVLGTSTWSRSVYWTGKND